MKKLTLILATLCICVSTAALGAGTTPTIDDSSTKSDSITGFGNNLGSQHFLDVGVMGGYGAFVLVLGGPEFGANASVTFLDHLEVRANLTLLPVGYAGVSLGTVTMIYADIMYRGATGKGFFIGPSFGNMSWSVPANPVLPSGFTIPGLGFTFGAKVGYDIGLTNFLSLGLEVNYFALTLGADASLKFWF